MTKAITAQNLKKYYTVYKKEPGISGSIKSIFSRQYFEVKAVDGVSFDIDHGELVGFIGPNGAGKTTTLKMLSGLLYPTSGMVEVLGFKPYERKSEFQKQFSLVMGQKNQLWWDLPVWESLVLNKAIYEIPENHFEKNAKKLAEMLNINDILKIQARKLSLGQRMRAELLAALLHSPKVLFLDEPTIGLDVVAQKNLRDFVKEYNKENDATVILTSHNMEDVKELCRRIIIIDNGIVIYDGLLSEIVHEFAPNKIVKADFEKTPDKKELSKIGKIRELNENQATLSIKRALIAERTSKLLADFQVRDFSVEELPIEEIIRQIFEKSVSESES